MTSPPFPSSSLVRISIYPFPIYSQGLKSPSLSVSLFSLRLGSLYPSLFLSLAYLFLFRPGLLALGGRVCILLLVSLLKATSPSPHPFQLPLPPPRGIVGGNKMWGESGAGRSPQCGAGRAQPMGSADGGARGGGAGAGRYFCGGRASAVLSGRAERSCEARARIRRRAGGREAESGWPGKLEGRTAAASDRPGAAGAGDRGGGGCCCCCWRSRGDTAPARAEAIAAPPRPRAD